MTNSLTNKALLIYSGYNQRAVISFIRFIKNYSIKYGIIASDKDDSIFETSYAGKVLYVRQSKELNVKEFSKIVQIACSKLDVNSVVIAPSTEGLNRWLIENRSEIETNGKVEIPLVSLEMYKVLSDKNSFSRFVNEEGLKVPNEFNLANLPKNFVAKPRQYVSANGKSYSPIIINSESQKEAFLGCHDPSNFYFQEYVEGPSYYLLYYCSKNGKTYSYSQENLVQQSGGKSILCAVESTIHNEDISNSYVSLLSTLEFHGFIMIELKRKNGDYFMIEANPRFWGPFELVRKNRPDLFYAFLADYGFKISNSENTAKERGKYFWLGGYKSELLGKRRLTYYNYSESQLKEALDDWILHDIYNQDDTRKIFNKVIK